jgi:iron complex outermembrane recepter protein
MNYWFGLVRCLCLSAAASATLVTSTFANESGGQATPPTTQLPELNQSATSVQEWLAQIAETESSGSATTVTQVIGIKLNPTATGIEVVLEAAAGAGVQSEATTANNAAIVTIDNAVLALPDSSDFRADQPAAGIASIAITQLDANRIQIQVVGTDGVPAVLPSDTGLTLTFNPVNSLGDEAAVTPENPEEDEEIELVVTATRTEEEVTNVPQSVTVIGRDQIQEQAKISRNLQEVLGNLVPGFGPPTQLNLLNSAQNLRGRFPQVLIDGVPIKSNVSTSQARDLRSIDPAAVERIEVVRGASAIYGDGGTGGVINIITRKPGDQPLTFTAEVGVNASAAGDSFLKGESFGNTQSFGISGQQGIVDFTLSLARDDVGRFFDAEGDLIPNQNQVSESVTYNVLGKLGFKISEKQRLEVTLNHINTANNSTLSSDPSVFDIPGIQKARAIEEPEPDFIGAKEPADIFTVANLIYKNDDLWGSKLEAQIFYRSNIFRGAFFDGRPFELDPGVVQFVFDKELFGGRLQIDTPIVPQLSVLWGADYSRESNAFPINVFDPDEFDSSGRRTLRKIDEIANPGNYTFSSLGLFAQLQWDVSDRWLINGGLRYDLLGLKVKDYVTEEFGFQPDRFIEGGNVNFDNIAFNLGTVYKPTEAISLFANFSQGFSAPDFSRVLGSPPEGFTSVENDLDVTRPQKVNSYELGIRGNWPQLQASLVGFYNTSDLGTRVVPAFAGNGLATIAREPQRIYGLEATVDWQPADSWGIGGSISWIEGEFKNEAGEFVALGSNIIQPLKLNLYVQHETKFRWRNRLQALYVGGRDRAFNNGTDPIGINDYITVDWISSIPIGKGQLSLTIENLFNTQYFPVSAQYFSGFDDSINYAGRGRSIGLSYSIQF